MVVMGRVVAAQGLQGWVKVQAGKSLDRRGQPLLLKLSGPVEAWFEDLGENPPVASAA